MMNTDLSPTSRLIESLKKKDIMNVKSILKFEDNCSYIQKDLLRHEEILKLAIQSKDYEITEKVINIFSSSISFNKSADFVSESISKSTDEITTLLIEKRFFIDNFSSYKFTLWQAIKQNNERIVRELIIKLKDPNYPKLSQTEVDYISFTDWGLPNDHKDHKNNAIHYATEYASSSILELLLENNTKNEIVKKMNAKCKNPIWLAFERNDPEILKVLIKKVTNQSELLEYLFIAIQKFSVEMVRELCEHHGLSDQHDINGITPLHLAVLLNKKDIVLYLLEITGNPNLKILQQCDNKSRKHRNPLGIIESIPKSSYLKDIDINEHTELSLLQIALKVKNIDSEIINQILFHAESRIRLNSTISGRTLLHYAAIGANLDSFNTLKIKLSSANMFSIDEQDHNNKTPLITAVENNNIEVARELIKIGANVRVVDNNEDSALHIAAKNNNKEIIIALLASGKSNIRLYNSDGKKAIELATCEDCCRILFRYEQKNFMNKVKFYGFIILISALFFTYLFYTNNPLLKLFNYSDITITCLGALGIIVSSAIDLYISYPTKYTPQIKYKSHPTTPYDVSVSCDSIERKEKQTQHIENKEHTEYTGR
jgi:ankyrin repeat protein